jgi:hypothetical protein
LYEKLFCATIAALNSTPSDGVPSEGIPLMEIKFNNIDELRAYLKSNDKREFEELRPVLVITMDDPVRNDGYQRPGVDFGQALVASIELSGYRACDACYDDKTADLCCFDFPSDDAWQSTLTTIDPSWVLSSYHIRQLDETGRHSKEQKRISELDSDESLDYELLLQRKIRVLILASHELIDHYLAKILLPWRGVPDELLPVVIHHGPDGGTIVPLDKLRSARTRFASELRFLFNHARNFCTVANRALFKIYLDDDIDKLEAQRGLPSLSEYSWEWGHPIFLQILHHLKDTGRVGTHRSRLKLSQMVTPFSFSYVYAEGLSIFEKTSEGYDFIWQGSGEFKEWKIPVGKAPRPEEQDPTAYSSHFAHHIFNVFQHMERTGLLGLDGNTIVLSPWGVKFLELLGAETRDPDVLLRWRSDDGELGTQKDVSSMDAWLERTFTSAKENIGLYFHTEEAALCTDAEFFNTGPISTSRLSILGVHVPITDSDFDDPEFAAEVATIAENETRIPISESYYGLVCSPPRMKTESKIIGLWIGVPLTVTYEDRLQAEPGWLRDTSREMAETIEAIRTATPAISRRLSGQEPRIIHGLPTKQKPGELRPLAWALAPSTPDGLRPIILGTASTIDLTGPVPEALRRRITTFPNRSPIPKYYDGINTFEGAGTNLITTTCGYFIGLYDEADDTFIVEREVHPDRVEAFGVMKRFMLGNLKAHFAIDRKEDGYWAVLKDGTVKRIFQNLNS